MASTVTYSTFCQPDDPANITIYETNGATLSTGIFTENSLFQQHIDITSRPHLRIVSIHSKSALSPLQISRDALAVLQDEYNLGPELWDLTVTFGNKPLIAAAGEGVMRIKDGDNDIRDISHRFTFPVTGGPGRWTIRQIGIFHRHDPKTLQNLWIFLHANPNTPVQKEIEIFASKPNKGSATDFTWFELHQAVLAPCLNGWRSYVNHLGNDVDRHFDKALTFVYESMNNNGMADGDGNLADIHNTRNRLLDIPSRLMTTLDTLQRLEDLSLDLGSQHKNKDNGFKKLAKSAAYYKEHLGVLVKGVEIMKEKVADMLKMIEIGLSFRMTSKMLNLNMSMVDLNNRMLGANQQLLSLGTKSFDDNATVKVVTIVTLIYLPASLVSSILGMNLFKFDDGTTEEFTISKQFWIFVVATIILAAITLSGWFVWTHKEAVKRRKSRLPSQDTPKVTEQDIEGKEN